MKWMFGLIFTGFLFTACDNELVVTDKWKDIPIVWAFLSKSDTAVYIRVEKDFKYNQNYFELPVDRNIR